MKKLLEIVEFLRMEIKKGAGNHVSNWCQEVQVTNACNNGLRVTPYRNYGSGLPKEAYIRYEQFPCQSKMPILGNFCGILPVF